MDDHGDLCERVASAIADGRFLEDPGLWRSHVEACETCRERVGGLFALRERMKEASLAAPVVERTPAQDGLRTIETAFRRYHRHRRMRNTSLCVAAALVFGTAALLATREDRAPPLDPVAYAKELRHHVFGDTGAADYGLLHRDAELRAEYLAALDHPSSYVRRTALSALLLSAVPVEASRLERVLADFHEDLEFPLEVASTSDGSRALAEELQKMRVETLRGALYGLQIAAANGALKIAPSKVVPFLENADAAVRRHALLALTQLPDYVPESEVTRLLESDPDAEVRLFSAVCLVRRRGDEGAALVIERLEGSKDDAFEAKVLTVLGVRPPTVAFSKRRMASGGLSVALALAHARVLLRSGVKEPPDAVIARALEAPAAETFFGVASIASEADWPQYRERLQVAWEKVPKADRTNGGMLLVLWDVRAGDERRARMALDVCEADRNPGTRASVVALSVSGPVAIRDRALALLKSWPEK